MVEVWRELRPFLLALFVDWCISANLWISLFVFKQLTHALAIDGWAGTVITTVHSASMILAFMTFGVLFALDVWEIRKNRRKAKSFRPPSAMDQQPRRGESERKDSTFSVSHTSQRSATASSPSKMIW